MTNELLDCLDAGLKMAETGESTGRRLLTSILKVTCGFGVNFPAV